MTAFGSSNLRKHFHACAFVNSAEEEREIVEPFFVEGMGRRERGASAPSQPFRAGGWSGSSGQACRG